MACRRSSTNSAPYAPPPTAIHSASPNTPATIRPTKMRFSPTDLAVLYSVDMASLYTIGPHMSRSHRSRVCNYTAKTGSADRSDAFMAVLGPMFHAPNDILVVLVLNDKHTKDLFDDSKSDSCKTLTQHSVAFGVYNNDTGMLAFPHLSQSHPVMGNVGKFSWRFGSMAFASTCCPGAEEAATLHSLFANMSNTKFVFTRIPSTSYINRKHQTSMSNILKDPSIACWLTNMVNVADLNCLFESGCSCSDLTAETMWQDAADADASLNRVTSGRSSVRRPCAPCGSSVAGAQTCADLSPSETDTCMWFGCGPSGPAALG